MQKDNKLYYCYSINQLRFLKDKGLRYLCKGLNDKTNKNYWVFEKNEELSSALSEFTYLKNKALN